MICPAYAQHMRKKKESPMSFLPVTPEECPSPDFVYVCGDAYIDHPSFGAALIARVLESKEFSVAMLPQPDWRSTADFRRFGRPRLGFLVSAGNLDSMVAHYTAARRPRSSDYYTPGGAPGRRPDRAVIVYCNRIREAYGDVPIIIGGLEASLRRFAHYDYWDDAVRRSILVDSRADILSYGMGERSVTRVAELLARGVPVKKIRDVPGTAYLCRTAEAPEGALSCGDYDTLKQDGAAYARAFALQYRENDCVRGKTLTEGYGERTLVCLPPSPPLERDELDAVYALPFERAPHPMYGDDPCSVPAIEEVRFSITHNRGCFGGCAFCAIAYHQGRSVRSRSIESCVREAEKIAALPGFKGYIHDVGGPTANFRHPSCEKQLERGMCARRCLAPKPCPHLDADQSEYLELLRAIEAVPGVKRVFVRSGIRYDYLLLDPDKRRGLFRHIVAHNVSGQLKVAPEHIAPNVLRAMGKPGADVYDKFAELYYKFCDECGREQYLVPYLMSSHPGCTLEDAAALAEYLRAHGMNPEQVQDFYPTPGTAATVMYYTGLDPFTMKRVYVPKGEDKRLQRALLQPNRPENRALAAKALAQVGAKPSAGAGTDSGRLSGAKNAAGAKPADGRTRAPSAGGKRPGARSAGADHQPHRRKQRGRRAKG